MVKSQSPARSGFDVRKQCARNAGFYSDGLPWRLFTNTMRLSLRRRQRSYLALFTIVISVTSITLIDLDLT